jgi:hypothetical protein
MKQVLLFWLFSIDFCLFSMSLLYALIYSNFMEKGLAKNGIKLTLTLTADLEFDVLWPMGWTAHKYVGRFIHGHESM